MNKEERLERDNYEHNNIRWMLQDMKRRGLDISVVAAKHDIELNEKGEVK